MIHCHKHKIEYGYEPCPECKQEWIAPHTKSSISRGQDIIKLQLENAELKSKVIELERWIESINMGCEPNG